MKKLFLSCIILVGLLTACALQYPEGFSEDFYYDAKTLFEEIDDDTMEMEVSDEDDLGNLDLADARAITEKEQAFITKMYELVDLQQKIYNDDKSALKPYIQLRRDIAALLNVQIYKFQFVEDN